MTTSGMNAPIQALAAALAMVLLAEVPPAFAQSETKHQAQEAAVRVHHAGAPRHGVAAHEASIRANDCRLFDN